MVAILGSPNLILWFHIIYLNALFSTIKWSIDITCAFFFIVSKIFCLVYIYGIIITIIASYSHIMQCKLCHVICDAI